MADEIMFRVNSGDEEFNKLGGYEAFQRAVQASKIKQEQWGESQAERKPVAVAEPKLKLTAKEQLAQELGMRTWASQSRIAREMEQSAKELTDMKFNVTNLSKIQAKIMGPIRARFTRKISLTGLAFAGACVAVGYLGKLVYLAGSDWVIPVILAGVAVSARGVFTIIDMVSKFDDITVNVTGLTSWQEEIPYGGLLAVKEAKDKGLDTFKVAYPTTRSKLLKDDPVIFGYKGEVMVEIFAWDAGKVYE